MSNPIEAPPRRQECPPNFIGGCAEDGYGLMYITRLLLIGSLSFFGILVGSYYWPE